MLGGCKGGLLGRGLCPSDEGESTADVRLRAGVWVGVPLPDAGVAAAGARKDMLRLKKFRSKMRYYGLRRLTQQLQVPTYVCKCGTNKIRAEAEVQCPCLLTLAFGANLIQPTHNDRVYEKIHGTGTHVAHR